MKKEFIMPKRIVTWESVDFLDKILEEKPLQTNFTTGDCTVIHEGGYILLDFGIELNGGIVMSVQKTVCSTPGARCRIVFGESVMEALSTIGYKNATNDHSIRDTVIDVSAMSTTRFGATGFRFVKIESVSGDIYIKSLKAQSELKDIEYQGSFECNDSLLNEIWKTGAYTVHLNMNDFIWDGIKRDRLVWIGDMHPEMSTVKAVFGYDDSIENSLDFVKNEYAPDEWMNRIPTYSMWWIIIHYDWYMQNGNLDYLKNQEEYISGLIKSIEVWIKNENKSENDVFVDWSSKADPKASEIGAYAVAYMALLKAKSIFEILGNTNMAEECLKLAESIKTQEIPNQKQIAGLCAYSGLYDSKKVNRDILSKNPLYGLSTFIGYYVLNARAMAGDIMGSLEIIRKYWGAMLELGATTFWEDFDIGWTDNAGRIDEIVPEGKTDAHGDRGKFCYMQFRHSLCHGWASGPTAFLSEYILGINIVEPGCRKIRITQNIGDLQWVKGTYPTPMGKVYVEHRRVNGEIVTTYSAPDTIEIEVVKE